MIKLVIFDMDGTIADTSPGIYASYRHVAEYLGVEIPSDDELNDMIGGALPENLVKKYKISQDKVQDAVNVYRGFYAHGGFQHSNLYPGFKDVIIEFYNRGYKLAIATMKAEFFAEKLTEMWGIKDYFISINGVDKDDTVTKPDMIRKCISEAGCLKSETVMVGDTAQDCKAATECGIKFIAVTYGFQYRKRVCQEENIMFVETPLDLLKVID